MADSAPLAGISVLDFSTVGPAARCSRILADYGAAVIKIGAPPSRASVQIEPAFHAYSAQRGMKRIRLDLKSDAGREAFLDLAASADVVIESFRPGVVSRLGIGYEQVRERNPGIVYCSTSGYGQDGPYSQWAGHDLNYLALGGYLDCSGRRADGGPPLPGATIADSAAGGMQAVIAILAALMQRSGTGEGAYLDVSVAEGVLSIMSLAIDQHLATGERPAPGGDVLSGRYACYDSYRARDGRWLAVAAIEPAFYANLCKALGLEQWIAHQHADEQQEAIRTAFREVFAGRDRDDWVAELAPANTCVSPVYAIHELVADPHLAARGAFAEVRHASEGTFRQLAPLLAGMPRESGAIPDTGATDTDAVLRSARIPQPQIDQMREEGVIA